MNIPLYWIDPSKIPPRTLNERLRLAIHWSRDTPDDELAAEFVHHLSGLGLKLVWLDGRELTPEQIGGKYSRGAGGRS
jgi:hypothetical protein